MEASKIILPLALLAALFSGCTHKGLLMSQEAFVRGQKEASLTQIAEYAEKNQQGKDAVIAHLEKGLMNRYYGNFERSNDAFRIADETIDRYDLEAATRVSADAGAILTNLNALPYTGKNYDRIMLSSYRAMNFLNLGDFDAARVEMNRALSRQQEAVEGNAKRIEAMQAELEGEKSKYDPHKSMDDPKIKETLRQYYGDWDTYASYSLYVNPFCEWLQGVYFMTMPADVGDFERARVSFKRVAGMVPENSYVADDLANAEQLAQGDRIAPLTYVVFETGTAPKREEFRVDLPIILVDEGNLPYAGAAFPYLQKISDYSTYLEASTDDGRFKTLRLADMDAIVEQEFKQDLPIIITKTIISTATKAIKSYLSNKATEDKGSTGDIVKVANFIYDAATNQADLRTWATLPKEFQYVRFETPADGNVTLTIPSIRSISVSVAPGCHNMIFVRSLKSNIEPQVSQVVLKK